MEGDRLDKSIQQLKEVRQTRDNWDGYGARPTKQSAERAAIRFLRLLHSPIITQPSIVPMTCGNLQLEWHALGFDCEIEIDDTGELTGVIVFDNMAHEQMDGT
jgi:hypothetical protein